MANATMEQISEDLLGNWSERNKTDQDLQVSRERERDSAGVYKIPLHLQFQEIIEIFDIIH